MSRVRPVPVVLCVLVTEVVLAAVGSEITWDAVRHVANYRGVGGLLLRSVGAPWSSPWHQQLWRYDGGSTTIGLIVYLGLLAGATVALSVAVTGRHAVVALFIGIWSSSVLALALSQVFRLLVDGGGETAYAGPGQQHLAAVSNGTAQVYHAVYFGWIAAMVGAIAGLVTLERAPADADHPDWASTP